MKILFVSNGYKPHRWAGTETYTAGIAEEMAGRGHVVQVLCARDWDKGEKYWNGVSEDIQNGIRVRRINLNWTKSLDPFRYLYNNPFVARYLEKLLQEERFDLVHVTSCETLSASILIVIKNNHIPLSLSITDFWFLCPRINLLRSDGENCDGNTSPWDCLDCMSRGAKVHQWSHQLLPEKGAKIFLTKLSKVPLVTRQRGFRGMLGDMADRKRFMRHVFSLPDVRLVASKFVRDVHTQNGFDDPIHLHPYGHDLSWLEDYQGKANSDCLNIGFIGQISRSKGVHLLLEAARRLRNSLGEKLNFLIYGDLQKHPEYARQLESLAYGLNTVKFCGTYPRERSADVYSKMDVLVVPSLWYDFPLIIHEAFATKTPVIATNLGGMAEAVSHEVNGLLFERGNVDDLVHQIRRIVDEPGLIMKLKNGIPRVKDIHEDVNEIEEIYLGLCQSFNHTL
jgi:glycosyltransferase involved in cell wall biosynthesis